MPIILISSRDISPIISFDYFMSWYIGISSDMDDIGNLNMQLLKEFDMKDLGLEKKRILVMQITIYDQKGF